MKSTTHNIVQSILKEPGALFLGGCVHAAANAVEMQYGSSQKIWQYIILQTELRRISSLFSQASTKRSTNPAQVEISIVKER